MQSQGTFCVPYSAGRARTIQQQDVANLNQGQIVFFNVAASEEIELAAGAAMYLQASPSQIMSFIKNNGLISIDSPGAIPPQ